MPVALLHVEAGENAYDDKDSYAAALAYNAFEKQRDPSHAEAWTLERWLEKLDQTGFDATEPTILYKEMEFDGWTARMCCAPETVANLRQNLTQPGVLKDFLKPRLHNGGLMLTLRELVIVATKRGP